LSFTLLVFLYILYMYLVHNPIMTTNSTEIGTAIAAFISADEIPLLVLVLGKVKLIGGVIGMMGPRGMDGITMGGNTMGGTVGMTAPGGFGGVTVPGGVVGVVGVIVGGVVGVTVGGVVGVIGGGVVGVVGVTVGGVVGVTGVTVGDGGFGGGGTITGGGGGGGGL